MPFDVYLNVAVAGVLTGLVYGLMALGLSVIFGVVRVVNFAHGEMMSMAMYIAVVLFSSFHLDPLVMLVPIAAVMFVFGYALQAGLINPFITRPEHSQFLLVVALAIIIVNALLIIFGPDAQTVQTSYAYDSFAWGPLIVDATKLYAGAAAIVVAAALFAFFRFSLIGKAIRACADNYTGALVVGLNVNRLYALTFGIGAACVGAAGTMMTLITDVTPALGPGYTLLAFVIVITGGLGSMPGALLGGVLIWLDRSDGRPAVHAVRQEHVLLRHSGAGAAVAAAGPTRPEGGMSASWLEGLSPRHMIFLAVAIGSAADRAVAGQRLSAHRPHRHFIFRLHRTGLEHHDGLCRPALARSRDLCRARRLCRGRAVHPLRRRAMARISRRHTGLRGVRRRHRLSGVSLRRLRRLLRHPHHRVRRVRAHRLRSSGLRQRIGRPVPAGQRNTPTTICGGCAAARRCSIT